MPMLPNYRVINLLCKKVLEMSNNEARTLKQVDSIEQTCATCDHYVDGWDGWNHTRCGLCWLKWQDMVRGTGQARLDIDRASVCMVDCAGCCAEWTDADDD